MTVTIGIVLIVLGVCALLRRPSDSRPDIEWLNR